MLALNLVLVSHLGMQGLLTVPGCMSDEAGNVNWVPPQSVGASVRVPTRETLGPPTISCGAYAHCVGTALLRVGMVAMCGFNELGAAAAVSSVRFVRDTVSTCCGGRTRVLPWLVCSDAVSVHALQVAAGQFNALSVAAPEVCLSQSAWLELEAPLNSVCRLLPKQIHKK